MTSSIPFGDSKPRVHRLANGLTLIMEAIPYVRSASSGLWIRAGSAIETEKQSGVSHFLEHLFFKGTKTRTAREIVASVERCGGSLNGFTSRDFTCLYAKTLDSHVHVGIEVLADIVKNSTFCDLEKERQIVLEEIASIEDVPEECSHDLFVQRMWPDHALGRPVTGSLESVAALTPEEVRAYYETWYRPGSMVLSVAGNIDPDAVLRQVEDEFGGMAGAGSEDTGGAPVFSSSVDMVHRDIAQSHICVGFPGPAAFDEDRYAYDVLSCALGGGATSRLFDRIRESEGLAYSIYSFFSCYRRSGFLGIYAAVAPENARKAAASAFEELRRLCDAPLPADELELNRQQLKGSLLMGLERTFSRMSRAAKSMMYHGRIISPDEVVEALDGVTSADVQRLALCAFTRDRCAMLTLGPHANDEPLEITL